MALAPNIDNNLSYGKGGVFFQGDDDTGFLHLGNVPKFELTPAITKEDHFSSLSGLKKKDRTIQTEKMLTVDLDFEEYSGENMNIAFGGAGVVAGAQTAGVIDGVEYTPVDDRYTDLGNNNLSVYKITHGAVTGGPFQAGETVTGTTSSATGVVAWFTAGYLELITIVGTFVAAEVLTGGTSSATATSTRVTATLSDIVVVDDAATPTVRYVLGTDYNVDCIGGLLRVLSAGSIAGAVDISANYPTTVEGTIAVLEGGEISGVLLFIGTSDVGPRYRIDCWKVTLTATSAIGMISDAITPVSLNVEVFSDLENHPDSEFADITEIAVA